MLWAEGVDGRGVRGNGAQIGSGHHFRRHRLAPAAAGDSATLALKIWRAAFKSSAAPRPTHLFFFFIISQVKKLPIEASLRRLAECQSFLCDFRSVPGLVERRVRLSYQSRAFPSVDRGCGMAATSLPKQ